MAICISGLPLCNFGVTTRNLKEATQLGELVRKYYPDYTLFVNFNASSEAIYFVKMSGDKKVWDHYSIGMISGLKLDEVLTLEEFKQKYLTAPILPEVINNYQIY